MFKQAGAVQGFVYALLLKLSSGLAKTYGIAPGGEFRRALKEVCYFYVHVLDRIVL